MKIVRPVILSEAKDLGRADRDPSPSHAAQDDGAADGQAFNAAIEAELHRIGSGISVEDVLVRADMQNCHGCHLGTSFSLGEGVKFSVGIAATHINEVPETVDGVTRFVISPALRDIFAPNRARILADYLAGKPLPVHSDGTLGGGRRSD